MNEKTCATCGKPLGAGSSEQNALGPFCSERCRKIDLGRWLGERYRMSEPLSLSPEELGEQ